MEILQKASVWRARQLLTDALGGRNDASASQIALRASIVKALALRGPDRESFIGTRWPAHADRILRAAVPALNLGDLDGDAGAWVGMPIENSVLGRLGATELPAHIPVLGVSGISASWVSEGRPAPLSSTALDTTTHTLRKVQSLLIATTDFLRHSGAEPTLEAAMESAVAQQIDFGLFDEAGDGSGDAPESLVHAGVTIPSSGPLADDVRADLAALFELFGGAFARAVLVADQTTAAQLALLQKPLGESNLKLDGSGTFFGMPFLVARVPRSTTGGFISLVDGSGVTFSRGKFTVTSARDATVEMDNAPTNASAPAGDVAETTMVSLWQTNSVGLLATAEADWRLHAPDRCITLVGCDYSGVS